MPMYDSNKTPITEYVQSALSRPDVIGIKNRTLDGGWHVQTIGSGANILDVTAHLTPPQKLSFDQIKMTGSTVKVTFDGRYYTGVIDGDLKYTRLPSTDGPMFTVDFTLLVQEEGVA